MRDDELLLAYAETRSEAAFAELVHRHLPFVYSTARRQLGDEHLAQDVSQRVFLALAKKASCVRGKILVGWLFKTTFYECTRQRRSDQRRRHRETRVANNQAMETDGSEKWDALASVLDEALAELSESDRVLLLFRYFQGKSLHEVGCEFGLSDDAAQKRVSRALEKLRSILIQRGITIPSSALAAALVTEALERDFQQISQEITAAVTKVGPENFMNFLMNKTALSLTLISIFTVVVVLQRNAADLTRDEIEKLKVENVHLRTQLRALREARTDNHARAQSERLELMRLRAEVSNLHRQPSASTALIPAMERSFTNSTTPPQVTIETRLIESSFNALGVLGIADPQINNPLQMKLNEEQLEVLLKTLDGLPGVDLVSAPKVTTLDQRQALILTAAEGEMKPGQTRIGAQLDVVPLVDQASGVIGLTMHAEVQSSEPATGKVVGAFSSFAHAQLLDGQTLALAGFVRSRQGEIVQPPRQVVVLVTPVRVDPAGNRIRVAQSGVLAPVLPP